MKINELKSSKYLKNILVLSSGVGISQLIPLIALPFLTRYYSPYDFGILAIFLALTQLIAISSTLRLEMAVVLPKNDTKIFGRGAQRDKKRTNTSPVPTKYRVETLEKREDASAIETKKVIERPQCNRTQSFFCPPNPPGRWGGKPPCDRPFQGPQLGTRAK